MSFTNRQKAAAKAVVAVFETGKVRGNYSACAVLSDGAGISYGTHQATHASGTLYKIVKLYTEVSDDAEAVALKSYLPLLSKKGKSSAAVREASSDARLKKLLKDAGKQPKMRYAQDYVFQKNYLEPAAEVCEQSGFKYALSLLVIFDSKVHGNFEKIRDTVPAGLSEKDWIKRYCINRRNWLAGHSNPILRGTAIRPKTYLSLAEAGNWDLNAPLYIHGATITEDDIKFHLSTLTPDGKETEVETKPTPADPEEAKDDSSEQLEPVDNYPEEPKPGEPVIDKPAEPGVPIAGARPTDPAIKVEPAEPEKPSGVSAWIATVRAWWVSLGIGTATIGSVLTGAASNPTLVKALLGLGITAILAAGVIWLIYMIVRAIHLRARERDALELTKLEMTIKADPTKYNVEVNKDVKVGETPSQDIQAVVAKNEEDKRPFYEKIFFKKGN